MKTTIEINKDYRIRRSKLNLEIKTEEKRIAEEIREKSKPITAKLKEERTRLSELELDFQKRLILFFDEFVKVGTNLEIETQTGPNSETITKYTGKITKLWDYRDVCFNFSCDNFNDGKEFTVSGSALRSVKLLEENK